MARLARAEYLDPQSKQIFHVTSRCVRRAYLCGADPHTGQSFEHRRQWICERLEFLASVFAIDCLTYAVMHNHFHLILRSRPDIVRSWSDEEVARRWLQLCPPRFKGKRIAVTEAYLSRLLHDQDQMAEWRRRLSDISWWMRMTAEKIARQANREDGCTGRFWEGRFRAQQLLDEAAILACAMYVDLNPIRAAVAKSLESSKYTGAKSRVDDLRTSRISPKGRAEGRPQSDQGGRPPKPVAPETADWERGRGRRRSGWLSPIEISERVDPTGPDPSNCGRRASRQGFLRMSLGRYLELLDWTGRQLRHDKRGSIPSTVKPILESLGLAPMKWLELAGRFGRLFKRAAGNQDSLSDEADRRGQKWLQAPGRSCFS